MMSSMLFRTPVLIMMFLRGSGGGVGASGSLRERDPSRKKKKGSA
jgi:hypothetical protein